MLALDNFPLVGRFDKSTHLSIIDEMSTLPNHCQSVWAYDKILQPGQGRTQGSGARAAQQSLELLILVRIRAPLPDLL